VAVLLSLTAPAAPAQGPYLKIDPPPDANKQCFGCDASCWLAAAANMLAGAGYGSDGLSVQDRADEVYQQLKTHLSGAG
jgi:hypothetical protein